MYSSSSREKHSIAHMFPSVLEESDWDKVRLAEWCLQQPRARLSGCPAPSIPPMYIQEIETQIRKSMNDVHDRICSSAPCRCDPGRPSHVSQRRALEDLNICNLIGDMTSPRPPTARPSITSAAVWAVPKLSCSPFVAGVVITNRPARSPIRSHRTGASVQTSRSYNLALQWWTSGVQPEYA